MPTDSTSMFIVRISEVLVLYEAAHGIIKVLEAEPIFIPFATFQCIKIKTEKDYRKMPRTTSKSQDKAIPVSASKTAKKSDSTCTRRQSKSDSESKENSKVNNVEEIVKRYSTHSEKEEQLSEECLVC